MAVLLIGSTGNGKSTLANFLLDPSKEHLFRNKTFATAKDNKPHTQEVKAVRIPRSARDAPQVPITIVDTPGLNDIGPKELVNMTSIVESLCNIGNIRACLFVVKFSTKIDAQYRDTVRYYCKLLPDLFSTNTAIVMTDFGTDERSVIVRQDQGVDVEQVKKNTLEEIKRSGRLHYNPTLFLIDCLPYSEKEYEYHLPERKALLEYISDQRPIQLRDVMVAKTNYIRELDDQRIKHLEGEVEGYKEQLTAMKQSHSHSHSPGTVLNDVLRNAEEIRQLRHEQVRLQDELKDKDSGELITVRNHSINEDRKFFRSIRRDFDLRTDCTIQKVTRWNNGKGKIEWTEWEEGPYHVRGTVTGSFRRGLYATIRVQAIKRERYARDIDELQQKIKAAKDRMVTLKENGTTIVIQNILYAILIHLLQFMIDSQEEEIKELKKDTMTLEQARQKLEDILAD